MYEQEAVLVVVRLLEQLPFLYKSIQQNLILIWCEQGETNVRIIFMKSLDITRKPVYYITMTLVHYYSGEEVVHEL